MESIVKKILNFTKLVGISICCLDLQENRKNEGSFKDAFERDFVLKMPVFWKQTCIHTMPYEYKHALSYLFAFRKMTAQMLTA